MDRWTLWASVHGVARVGHDWVTLTWLDGLKWASQLVPVVKNSPANAGRHETQVWSLGWEDPLEEGMATHSSILAWRIPWTEEPGRLWPISQRLGYNWSNLACTHTHGLKHPELPLPGHIVSCTSHAFKVRPSYSFWQIKGKWSAILGPPYAFTTTPIPAYSQAPVSTRIMWRACLAGPGATPRISDSVRLECCSLRTCISNKFQVIFMLLVWQIYFRNQGSRRILFGPESLGDISLLRYV